MFFQYTEVKFIGTLHDPSRLLNLFDLAFAMGRSALESMSCGIPTLIVGPRGFAGIVRKEQIDQLAYYNFSGRNVKDNIDEKPLVKEIVQILKSPEKARDLGVFSRRYVLENYDVKEGAKKLGKIYEEVIAEYANKTFLKKATGIIKWIYTLVALYTFLPCRKIRNLLKSHR